MTEAPLRPEALSPLQRAALTIRQLRARLSAHEAAAGEPIAVIGLGCRLPGGADTPDAFWALLREGREALGGIPPERWDADALYDPDPAAPGRISVRHGHFLREVDRFDPAFFGISPREAASLDPQQRLLLEVAWETLEDAGHSPERLAGSRTGVFLGIGQNDYAQLRLYAGDPARIDTYDGTGNGFCFASGRLAHILRLRGPNLAIDTACSSSLVAVHLACQSLRGGESDLALAGGVQLILSPEVTVFLSRARALSPDGRCKAFDAAADGYGRGEGCGLVALKRLSDAERDGDRVLALIRGSAVNHNGPGSGLTVPSGPAQQALLREALAAARLEPAAIDYLEAHGTGTALGDPIEVGALAAVLGRGRPPEDPLLIGSVKSNIGHLEAAAGIAGLIKVVLALRHGVIPASLHLRRPNPAIPWAVSGVAVAAQPRAWPERGAVRAAGVSSFGISGTNAHVVLTAPPAPAAPPPVEAERPLHLLALSARTPEALREQARRLEAHLAREDAPGLADACYTANAGRAQHGTRLALLCEDMAGLRAGLAGVLAGRPVEDLFEGGPAAPPSLAWLFTGQGSQYAGMARALYETQPRFRRILDACDAMLRPALSPSLLEAWFAPGHAALLDRTEYTQPALFVLQHALAELWSAWGVEPAALLGHSVGEYAAACRAGVFSLEDGLRLIAARGRLMGALPAGGMMAAVAAGEARVAAALPAGRGEAVIAAVNGPRSTVVSGRAAAVEAVLAELAREGIAAQPLRTSHAFHSPLIEPMLGEFAELAAGIRMAPPRLPLLSNLDGAPAGAEIATPEYWCRQARQPVRFAAGLAALAQRGCTAFLEIGPAPVLLGLGRQVLAGEVALWLPSLRPGLDDWRQMLRSLAALYTGGAAIDWAGFDRDHPRRRVALPTTAFQRQRYWVSGGAPKRTPEAEVPPDWLYRTEWQPAPAVQDAAPAPGCWLLLADGGGVAARLAGVLEGRGGRCLLLPPNAAGDPEALRRRLAAFQDEAGLPLRGALHLGGLDAPGAETGEGTAAETAACAAGLALLRALPTGGGARLWFVTRAAVPASEAAPRLALRQSVLWGLGRSIALERPELWGGLIDLDPAGPEAEAPHLAAALEAPAGESQIALRGEARLVPRLAPFTPPPEGATAIRADATYLVTGGFGGLGLELARWLVRRGATHLVLLGRSEPSATARAEIARLEAMGARLRPAAVDVADVAAVTRLLERVAAEMPPLRGILHAAGTAGTAPLEALDAAALEAAFRAKVAGTLVLDRLTRGLDLDFFACFSSIASLWGGKGQAAYAAANAFLDAFAQDRRARGLPGLAVNWGPWAAGGMASAEARALLGRMGIRALGAAGALAALSRLLASDLPQVAVVDADWSVFRPLHQGRGGGRFLERLGGPEAEAPPAAAAAPLLRQLREAGPGRRHGLLVAHLREQLARILGFPEGRLPDPREGFFQLGMDSLMALELRGRLARDLGQSLPAALVFDAPTAEGLAGAVLALLDRQAPEPAPAAPIPVPAAPRAAATREPIAILGMACRLPGGADDPERFWALLREGRDAIRRVPAERWDADAFYDPAPGTPGAAYTRHGGFIEGVELFDAAFFGIAPREAAEMDPQHRLLLEAAHAALEDAGHARRDAADRTGVFVGLSNGEYGLLLRGEGDPARIGSYYVTGNALNAAAGRISYALGLQGPAMAVDTACSSSLVAVHLACASLWSGECDTAIAAGANLILTPDGMVAACQARMLSPDGRCKSFDAAADGYGRGEGCGAVVLRRLSKVAPGERVWAVIRGTAVNQDGRGSGFTVPSGPAQQAVIRAALAQAGVEAPAVGYVEAHGTGTALGDPIEAGALGAVYGRGRPADAPLLLGSVKANIGHLESAAGIAGLIKAALVLHHGEIPPQPNLRRPNPEIDWAGLGLRAAEAHRPWPGRAPRLAGVSSFGLSGTNAHAVLEAPPAPAAAPAGCDAPAHLLTLSARTPEALRGLAAAIEAHLAAHPAITLGELCRTANARGLYPVRAAWVPASVAEARAGLRALAAGEGPAADAVPDAPRIGLLLGGEAAAGLGLVRLLHATQPAFREALDRIGGLFHGLLPRPLPEVILGEEDGWRRDPAWSRPAGLALGHALAALWAAWGIRPVVVTGQGPGALLAACLAGRLELEEAVRRCAAHRPGEAGAGPGIPGITLLPEAPDPEAAAAGLRREGCDLILAIGARLPAAGYAPAVLPDPTDWHGLLETLAALHRRGVALELRGLGCGTTHRLVSLPTYPFQRRRHWLSAAPPGPARPRQAAGESRLLGRRLRSATGREEIEFEALPGPTPPDFLEDHRVLGAPLLPSAVLLELVLEAAGELLGSGPVAITGYEIRQAAVLEPGRERALHLVLRPRAEGGHEFELLGAEPGSDRWLCHAAGALHPAGAPPPAGEPLAALRARLARELPVAGFHERLRRHGIELGPRFRALHRLWTGEGEALGEIRLPEGTGAGAFRVHPVLLDACFQLVGAALGGLAEEATYLQAGIARLVLHAPPGREVFAHARLLPGAAPPRAELRILAADGAPIATVEGLRLAPAPAAAPPARELCYELAWPALPEPEHAPAPMAEAAALGAALADGLREAGAAPALAGYGAAVAAIEGFCAEAAARALGELGWQPGRHLAAGEAAGALGVAPRHRLLLRRLLAMLSEAGWLAAEAGGWRLRRLPAPDPSGAAPARLRAAHPGAAAELDLLGPVAARLPALLRGTCDPQEVLFPGGATEPLRRLYADSPLAAAMNALAGRALAAAIARWPEGRPLRVLEIGAGTGATTAALLPPLAGRCTEYLFSDVSDSFTVPAAERFRAHPFLRPALLDIERDPAGQGFAGRQFDILVAANVLHATRDLAAAVGHARQLLAPGGLLLLLEGTAPLRFLDLTFGLLEGWWRFAGDPARGEHPLLGAEAWRALLEAAGFGEICEAASTALGQDGLPAQAVIAARAVAGGPALAGHWLVLADRGGTGAALAGLLRDRGARVSLLEPETAARTDAALRAEYRRALAAAAPLNGVVHLGGLDATLAEESGAEALRLGLEQGCRPALCLAQAMLETPGAAAAPLTLVTRGAVAVGSQAPAPAGLVQAPAWGLGKVLASEHRALRCQLVDLDPADSAPAEALLAALLAPPGEGRVALRAGRRHAARLVRARLGQGRPGIRPDRAYLVTGGLGGIGLRVAGWLAGQGARHLALLGRSAPGPAAREAIRGLVASGVQVLPLQADVAQPEALAGAFAAVREGLPPLAGVLHAAGVVADRLVPDQEWRLFEQVLAPKAGGAWALHQLTRDLPLDHFVLFSSASTLLGGAGLANYVAANEFLDALAAHRRRLGLPGLSIAWGPWAGLGMARGVGEAREAEWRAIGLRPLAPAEALAALGALLPGEAATAGVLAVDWARLRGHPLGAALGGLLEGLAPNPGSALGPAAAVPPSLRAGIEAAPPGEAPGLLLAHVRAELGAVLGWDPGEPIPAGQGFFDLGMDSLQANELRNRLQASLGCALPPSLAFRFPTAAALAAHLAREILGDGGGGGEPPAPAPEPMAEPPSTAETEAGIRRELARLEQLLGSA